MANEMNWKRMVGIAVPIVVVVGIVTAAAISWRAWWPSLRAALGSETMSSEAATATSTSDHNDHSNPDVLTLSPQAKASLGLRVEPLRRSDFERSIRIPGRVVKIPGVTDVELTARSSGEIEQIRVLEGQLVKPGAALFKLQLIHEEAIKSQLELLDALARLEVVNAEIKRLQQLLSESPGAVPRTRLLTQLYERGHLQHTIDSRRQILTMLGLPANDVEALIQRHQMHHSITNNIEDDKPNPHHDDEPPLLERITLYAPRGDSLAATPDESPLFVMEQLGVHLGQHVDVGDTLCRLSDYRRLYIEGQAFQRDLQVVNRAMRNGWRATAALEQHDGERVEHGDLPILYIDSTIDEQSGAARFFVEVENELLDSPMRDESTELADTSPQPQYANWRVRPGQRLELRVPVEQYAARLVVPVTAVAQDGVHSFVFQVSGNTFVRREVAVEYRDENVVVLSETHDTLEGASLAMTGAYQLNLALLNRASGPSSVHPHPHAH